MTKKDQEKFREDLDKLIRTDRDAYEIAKQVVGRVLAEVVAEQMRDKAKKAAIFAPQGAKRRKSPLKS